MDTGTKLYRNYFRIPFGLQCDIQYGRAYPIFRKMMFPGDVFKIHADLLIRYQPMYTPPMNDCIATVRFGFVPLRLVEENTELIITGSKEGKLYNETIPTMDSVFKYLTLSTSNTVEKHSVLDYLYQIPTGLELTSDLCSKLDADKASPAAYHAKAFYRFWFDYYRDENLNNYNDFNTYWINLRGNIHREASIPSVCLRKDRLTSSLPWQLKAVAAPLIPINATASAHLNVPNTISLFSDDFQNLGTIPLALNTGYGDQHAPINALSGENPSETTNNANIAFRNQLAKLDLAGIDVSTVGISWSQVRDVGALTRIYERLARCGSRYTEYLRANFGVAPADDTLQRAQYLGGFKTRIVTTEVVQTAGAGDNPVGTLRGHGITHGTSTIKPFMAKEIGIIVGILDVKPETIYAQGVDRELTYRSRFDFLNPSFQHLSEQEVRKGEVYFNIDTNSDTNNLVNSETWGFQPYAQELRTGVKHVCGDMRDSLSAWNQSLIFSSRPSLNNAFISANNHTASYNRPFVVSTSTAYPMLVDFGGIIEAYRPLVKSGTPGLVDHN